MKGDRSLRREAARLVDRLLQLPEEERFEALEELGNRPEIEPRVLERVRMSVDSGFLSRPASEIFPGLAGPAVEPDEPLEEDWFDRRLGAWRIVEPLGEGGMGKVFRVVRADGQFEMEAALKLFSPRSAAAGLEDRFRRERQILAGLDHPSIARLLDGGTTEDGRPWLVLELVEGEPIDRYCERQAIHVRQRLRLFLRVCAAVSHAHQRLVVHRDLKPSNVLVDESGQVRLLDFGIAGLQSDGVESAADSGGPRFLTLSCAAPEQIRGQPSTTVTDVYGLGVLLSRLLDRSAPDAETAPSRSASGQDRSLDRDLEAIVRRATADDPNERYSSVEALAEDIRRHLDSLPVRARRATPLYRFRKLVRRQRLGIALVALLLAGLVGVAVLFSFHAREAERARERSERVTVFVSDLLSLGDPAAGEGTLVAADTLLTRALERARTEFADQPRVEAAVLGQAGRALVNLGRREEARIAFERSIRIRRQLGTGPDPDIIADLQGLGSTFRSSDRFLDGVSVLEEAVDLARRLYRSDDPRLAEAVRELAVFEARHQPRGFPGAERFQQRARRHFREALEIYRRAHGDRHPSVAETMRHMAFTFDDLGSKLGWLERSVALYEEVAPTTKGLAYSYNDLGLASERSGDREAAERALRRASQLLEELEEDDSVLELQVANNLAGVLRDGRKFAAAERVYRQVLARSRRLLPQDHGIHAFALYGLGRCALGLGNAAEAEIHLEESAELLEATGRTGLAAVARGWLAEALAAQGRGERAAALATRSHRVLSELRGGDDPEVELAARRIERLRSADPSEPPAVTSLR